MKRTNIFDELAHQKKEMGYYKQQATIWQERYYQLEKELKETKKLLQQFLNANTPSSKLPPQFKTTSSPRPEKGTVPRGKPEGSNGATRDYPEKFDRTIKAPIPHRCQRCGKKLDKHLICRPVYDIIFQKFVTEFLVEESICDCGECYVGTHPELPERGMFSHKLQAFITELKHNFAGSYEKISNFLGSLFGIYFTQTAMNDCMTRVAEQLEPSYDNLEEKLPKTKQFNGDETSWPVNGVLWYLWLFVTTNFIFIHIVNSRARRVLTDLFGEDYQGVCVSDCFRAYRNFAKQFQKDWVHLLRKTYFEKNKHPHADVCELHKRLSNFYDAMKEFLADDPTMKKREKKYKMFHRRLKELKNYQWKSKSAKDIVKNWLVEYDEHWLTAILVPGITLDNNVSERGIRKVIPWRKLLGGHRTWEGARNFAIIETHRQTWQMNGKSSYEALVDHLKNRRKEIVI